MQLLLYVFEIGKVKSAVQSVLMILTLNGLFQEKKIGFYFTLGNSRQNKAAPLETPHNCVTPFKNFTANQDPWKFHVIFSWWRPENCTLFLSHKNTFIAIENLYLSEWSFFQIKNLYLSIKKISMLKSSIIFNKTVCWYKLTFPNFPPGNSVIFFNRFWNVYDFLTDVIL